jgi:hypothetical protein
MIRGMIVNNQKLLEEPSNSVVFQVIGFKNVSQFGEI